MWTVYRIFAPILVYFVRKTNKALYIVVRGMVFIRTLMHVYIEMRRHILFHFTETSITLINMKDFHFAAVSWCLSEMGPMYPSGSQTLKSDNPGLNTNPNASYPSPRSSIVRG